MTRSVAVWPQAGTVHLSRPGSVEILSLTAAVGSARRYATTDPVLSGEIAVCVRRLWAQRAAKRAGVR